MEITTDLFERRNKETIIKIHNNWEFKLESKISKI